MIGLLLGAAEDAERFSVTVVAETATEVRIRVIASGISDEDDISYAGQVVLQEPLGDRLLIDDVRNVAVPLTDESVAPVG